MPRKKKDTIFDVNYRKAAEEEEEAYAPEAGLEDEPEEHGLPEQTHAELHAKVRGTDIYTEEGREDLLEDDEIAAWEQGYVEGLKAKETLFCRNCRKIIVDRPIEKEYEHQLYWFCSDACVVSFEERRRARRS